MPEIIYRAMGRGRCSETGWIAIPLSQYGLNFCALSITSITTAVGQTVRRQGQLPWEKALSQCLGAELQKRINWIERINPPSSNWLNLIPCTAQDETAFSQSPINTNGATHPQTHTIHQWEVPSPPFSIYGGKPLIHSVAGIAATQHQCTALYLQRVWSPECQSMRNIDSLKKEEK